MEMDIKQYCFSFISYLESLSRKRSLINHLANIGKYQLRNPTELDRLTRKIQDSETISALTGPEKSTILISCSKSRLLNRVQSYDPIRGADHSRTSLNCNPYTCRPLSISLQSTKFKTETIESFQLYYTGRFSI